MQGLLAAWSKGLMMMMVLGAAHGRRRSPRSKNATFWRGDEFGGRRGKTLYGSDDRLEESEVSDSGVLAVGAATAALVRGSDLSFNQASSTWYWRHSSCESGVASSCRLQVFPQLLRPVVLWLRPDVPVGATCRDAGCIAQCRRRSALLRSAIR